MVAVLCLPFNAALLAQQPPPVNLSMIVTDTKNKGVNTIRKDQIRVFEGKQEQQIISVEADERPVDYGIVIDASGSLRTQIISALQAVVMIIKNKRPGDEVFIERFISRDKIEKYQDFTTDGASLIESLKNFQLEMGQTAVIDGLYLAVDYVAQHNPSNDRRKVIVLITDGEDRNSFYKQEAVVNLLHETGVQVFVLGLVTDLEKESGFIVRSPRERAEKLLKTFADESGGRVHFPKDREEIFNSTTEIILDLRGQFRIKYQSTRNASKKGFQKVDVKFVSTDGEKRELIVPPGYFVGRRTPKKQEKKP
jgi:Ca-activated chloride channel family protein